MTTALADTLAFAHQALGCARHSDRGCPCGQDWCTTHPEASWSEQGCAEACRLAPLLESWAAHRENVATATEMHRWLGLWRRSLAPAATHDPTGQLHAMCQEMANLELELEVGLAAASPPPPRPGATRRT